MEDDYGDFDVTDTGEAGNPPPGPTRNTHRPNRKSVRVMFACCKLYATLPIPQRILDGELPSWRFHCPKCGGLVEIPV